MSEIDEKISELELFKKAHEDFLASIESFRLRPGLSESEKAVWQFVSRSQIEDSIENIDAVKETLNADMYMRSNEVLLSLNDIGWGRFKEFSGLTHDRYLEPEQEVSVLNFLNWKAKRYLPVFGKYHQAKSEWNVADYFKAFRAMCFKCKATDGKSFEEIYAMFEELQRGIPILYALGKPHMRIKS